MVECQRYHLSDGGEAVAESETDTSLPHVTEGMELAVEDAGTKGVGANGGGGGKAGDEGDGKLSPSDLKKFQSWGAL